MCFSKFLRSFVGVLLLCATVVASEPPFGVFNCARYGAEAPCLNPVVRVEYPRVYAEYLYYAALATFSEQAKGRLRLRRPALETRRQFRIGDMTQAYNHYAWGRSTSDGKVEVEWVSLQIWHHKDDLSAKLFVQAWMEMWNAELREPFPKTCVVVFDMQTRAWKQKSRGCVDLGYLSWLAVVNAKDHMVRRSAAGERD